MKRRATTTLGGVRKRPRLVRQGASMRMPMVRVPAVLRSRTPEVKTVDVPKGQVPLNTTANFVCLNAIEEGSSFYNRVGRKVMMRSLQINGVINQTGNNGGGYEYLRGMIVYDRQPNGAFPAIADLLQDVDLTGAATTNSFSGINMNNRDRFKVLADMRWSIPNDSNSSEVDLVAGILDYTKNEVNVNRFIPLFNLEAHYKASNGNQTDLSTGNLFLVTFGSNASGSDAYQLAFHARLRYHDV